ncbi:hypothetical protein PanWU01x14_206770 [Parasponia andersonii]|uniref:Uncharacterized protein n=1 Tax=Parasponia andersonii TaxID=3476 RepID=A0A2P5BVL5_PARAD|nr:hypothetical protein PanWU01x14_206770 [Parasponia andersonii]
MFDCSFSSHQVKNTVVYSLGIKTSSEGLSVLHGDWRAYNLALPDAIGLHWRNIIASTRCSLCGIDTCTKEMMCSCGKYKNGIVFSKF